MMFGNSLGRDTKSWQPLKRLFLDLVSDCPAHQLGGAHPNAVSKFLRRHARALHEAGIAIRLQSGTWLADPERLPAAVLLLATGGTLEASSPATPTDPKTRKDRTGDTRSAKSGTHKTSRRRAGGSALELRA